MNGYVLHIQRLCDQLTLPYEKTQDNYITTPRRGRKWNGTIPVEYPSVIEQLEDLASGGTLNWREGPTDRAKRGYEKCVDPCTIKRSSVGGSPALMNLAALDALRTVQDGCAAWYTWLWLPARQRPAEALRGLVGAAPGLDDAHGRQLEGDLRYWRKIAVVTAIQHGAVVDPLTLDELTPITQPVS